MEICKAPTLRLKALNMHSITHIMYIEMEMLWGKKKKKRVTHNADINKGSSITMKKMRARAHTHTHTHSQNKQKTHTQYVCVCVRACVRVCVRACVRVCVCVCVCRYIDIDIYKGQYS